MKVWIVELIFEYEGSEIIDVCSTADLAKERNPLPPEFPAWKLDEYGCWISELPKRQERYEISEFEVDGVEICL
jgi:hypothetical protein